jgi:hypothetical protein
MLSYSSSLLPVLTTFGIEYDEQGADDYCLLWNVVGWLLGVDETLLPMTRAEMERLDPLIRELNFGPSDAGRVMTAALIKLVRSFIQLPGLDGLPVSMMRAFIGNETSDMLGAPKADWTRFLVGDAREFSGHLFAAGIHDRVVRGVLSRVSRRILHGFVDFERQGDRPQFNIPDHLGAGFFTR